MPSDGLNKYVFQHKLIEALQLAGRRVRKIHLTAERGHITAVTATCRLLEHLDFTDRDIVNIDLEAEAHSIPLVSVTFCPTQEQEVAALDLLREYGMALSGDSAIDVDEKVDAAETERIMTWMKHVQWGKNA